MVTLRQHSTHPIHGRLPRPVSLRAWLAPGSDIPDRLIHRCVAHDAAVQTGDVFLALAQPPARGGHIASAMAKGAHTIVLEGQHAEVRAYHTKAAGDVLWVEVPALGARLGMLMAALYGDPSRKLHVAAITGTNGKSSCSLFYAQALRALQQPCGVIGTLGHGVWPAMQAGTHTTPDSMAMQQALAAIQHTGAEHCVLEASSHALVQQRLQGVSLQTAVFTNLSQDHLDYHGTMEAYAAAKASLFSASVPCWIVNMDDAVGRQWRKQWADDRLLGYGWQCPEIAEVPVTHAVRAAQVCCTAAGFTAVLHTPWGSGKMHCPVLGRFNVSNVLAVAAMLGSVGVPFEQIVWSLSQLQPVPGRMQRVQQPQAPLVVVDFAHTPDALAHVLQALRPDCRGRLWCVFGCGGDRDRSKRALMASQAEQYADRVVVTSDNPRSEAPEAIMADIRAGFQNKQAVCYIADRARAIMHAVTAAAVDDVVLVAGKGHEQFQTIGQHKHPFCDVGQVQLALQQRSC